MKPGSVERGFTLVELVVAAALGSLVLLMVFGTFFRSHDAARRVTGVVEARQGARAAIQLIERELRMAGSGWGRLAVNGSNNGQPMTVVGVNPGPNAAVTGCDSISILGGWDVMTTLRAAMPNPSAVLQCDSIAGFQDGDLCVITNGMTAHLFQVTQVMTGAVSLQHNPSSPFNVPGGHSQWPPSGYGPGARVYRASWVTYAVDSVSFGRPSLVRREMGRAAQLAAYDVARFQVTYRLQDGSQTRAPADLSLLDMVVPAVHTIARGPGGAPLADSVWAAVQPRTF
jgi:prepilin-type N-terminal cleavage/methylation domain-containing protein